MLAPRVPPPALHLAVRQVVQATEHCLHGFHQRNVWSEAPDQAECNARDSFYDETIEAYAQQPITKLTLRQMLEFGQSAWYDRSRIIESAEFVREELPKRLARRLMDLQLLPYIVVTNPHIKRVYNCYFHAFNTLRTFGPIASLADNEHFSQVLRRLVDEHAPMLDSLAAGLRECRRKPIVGEQLALDAFLENMLRSRISRRVLAEQHLNLPHSRPGYIGVIATDLSIAESVDLAAARCRQVCIETYGSAPDVIVSGDTALTIPYIPAHLDYMLYELLKNSARAVVERHQRSSLSSPTYPVGGSGVLGSSLWDGGGGRAGAQGGGEGAYSQGSAFRRLPPVFVRICDSEEQVTIRVSDQGGGILRWEEAKVWQYGFTTTTDTGRPGSAGSEGLGLDNQPPPGHSIGMPLVDGGAAEPARRFRMAGLGFGLPLSRLYARYFGGDLHLVNMAGYGVDAFLSLRKLDQDWQETPGDQGVEPLLSVSGSEPPVAAVAGGSTGGSQAAPYSGDAHPL